MLNKLPWRWRVRKRVVGGGCWRGVAQLSFCDGLRLHEQGAWEEGLERGEQMLRWGDGVLQVGEGARQHCYRLKRERGRLVGEYVCGQDVYGFCGPSVEQMQQMERFYLWWWVNEVAKRWALVAEYRVENTNR
ncbi:MAG: hypothetical protein EBQ80_05135 [Proteobacteria bacterium]|nr:hypothetical protein [Pseudomonadota bacterium]